MPSARRPPSALTPATPVPGEAAGVVDEVGEGVTGAAAGDEVLGRTETGAGASYALTRRFVPEPAALDRDTAAAPPVAAGTAAGVLDVLGLAAGETLLPHGAAGAVGSVAAQLAVARGATVIGTASPANHDYLRSLGVLPVADGEGPADRVREVAPGGVGAVFDAAGAGDLPVSVEPRGGRDRVVTIADPAAAEHGIPFHDGGAHPSAALAEYARQAADGRLRVRVAGSLPLADVARARELSGSGHAQGKIVLRP
ncbi:zinc-binding dehydrogenase [Streptomyces sp. NPDC058459]|uniref:zinc-binding dehydrogenase n=1 Tax=Streptomyces sp. NPDC058459 TaxID=3346508 RepID=UPI003665CF3C